MQQDKFAMDADPMDEDGQVIKNRDDWKHFYYKKENFQEVPGLEYTGNDAPKVIAESSDMD